jgi:hypothetical protein
MQKLSPEVRKKHNNKPGRANLVCCGKPLPAFLIVSINCCSRLLSNQRIDSLWPTLLQELPYTESSREHLRSRVGTPREEGVAITYTRI